MQTPPEVPASPLESLAFLTADLNSQVRALQAENLRLERELGAVIAQHAAQAREATSEHDEPQT